MKKYAVLLLVVLTIGNTSNGVREVKYICLALGYVKNNEKQSIIKMVVFKIKEICDAEVIG